MKKVVNLLCTALIFTLLFSVGATAAVDGSAYSVTGDMTPGTNVPDSEVDDRSNKESEGALERAYDSAKDIAETAKDGVMTEADKAMDDVGNGSTSRTLGIVIAIIIAVAVIIALIVIFSKKDEKQDHGRKNDQDRGKR